MARADYRLCDVCSGKAFYDANLNYEDGKLDYVGDWTVICDDCAKTHKCVVVALEPLPVNQGGCDADVSR